MKDIKGLEKIIAKNFLPPPNLSVSAWADTYRVLPNDSPEPGKWRTERVPYMRSVMDAFTQPQVKRIVVKSSAQTSKTECLLNIVGRYCHLDPCPIMIIQPTLELAEDFRRAA